MATMYADNVDAKQQSVASLGQDNADYNIGKDRGQGLGLG